MKEKRPSHGAAPRSLAVCVLEALGLLLFAAMVLDAGWHLLVQARPVAQGRSQDAWLALLALLTLPAAYYLADLLSGLIHWVCDSFGNEHTPLWGPALVGPFRRHHRDPLQITRISLLENLGASALAGDLVLWLWSPWAAQAASSVPGLAWRLTMLWLIVFAVLSNLFHRWSHLPLARRPGWMLWAQRHHLLLNSQIHGRHHRPPHRLNYCILSGWANPLSNRIPWAGIEAVLARLGIRTCFD
ncbi:fatty acid desaturase CarF family protein [Paucibacter sp. APW11]|uniref:Fatty acid desaturase CarF family protein n=1 Tax=Roseateles aquae TaxID=3077235 RepID=A0ABU3P7T2_9BURK|nr:fatty acid desaturase CarF family protein [Paucibacter sp. APW11]MDT8998631.1 fatty acid desaturase CarF family protein [Paucibacter sp. APW11]